MARVTVEDCLEQVPNRFALTVLASRRARALSEAKGTALVKSSNKVGVVALREIAKAFVRYEEDVEQTIRDFIEEQRAQLMAGSNTDATFIDAATFGNDDDDEDEDDDDVKELVGDPDKLEADDDEDEDEDDGDPSTPVAVEGDADTDTDTDEIADDDAVPAVLDELDDDDDDDDDDDTDDAAAD